MRVCVCVCVVATHAINMCFYHILARLTLNGTSFIEKLQGVLYITSMNLPTSYGRFDEVISSSLKSENTQNTGIDYCYA